jgi:hypothetical protein
MGPLADDFCMLLGELNELIRINMSALIDSNLG